MQNPTCPKSSTLPDGTMTEKAKKVIQDVTNVTNEERYMVISFVVNGDKLNFSRHTQNFPRADFNECIRMLQKDLTMDLENSQKK